MLFAERGDHARRVAEGRQGRSGRKHDLFRAERDQQRPQAFGQSRQNLVREAEEIARLFGAAERAHEVPLPMRVGMGILAVACAGLGLAAVPILSVLGAVLAGHAGLPAMAPRLGVGLSVSTPGGFAQMSPTLVALGLIVALAGEIGRA